MTPAEGDDWVYDADMCTCSEDKADPACPIDHDPRTPLRVVGEVARTGTATSHPVSVIVTPDPVTGPTTRGA